MKRVIKDRGRWYTRSGDPGRKVYGERLVRIKGKEFRAWSARRSKLGAYLATGGAHAPLAEDASWLYLGAASGTTVSHVCDLVPTSSVVAVESSVRPFRDLLHLASRRQNLVPVLSDARRPHDYEALLDGPADVVYQDIAQRDQARIFIENLDACLGDDAIGMIAIKARSINVAAKPSTVYADVRDAIEAAGYRSVDRRPLEPWQQDHAMLVVRRA